MQPVCVSTVPSKTDKHLPELPSYPITFYVEGPSKFQNVSFGHGYFGELLLAPDQVGSLLMHMYVFLSC